MLHESADSADVLPPRDTRRPRPTIEAETDAANAERIEALAMSEFVAGASRRSRSHLGIDSISLGGGVALAMAHDPTGYWSKALGFGITEPVTFDLIHEVVDFYTRNNVAQAAIQIGPPFLPEDWADIAGRLHLVQAHSLVKLQRRTTPQTRRTSCTSLTVTEVAEDKHAEWTRVMLEGFGMPIELDGLGAHADPGRFRRFAAFDDGNLVATAAVLIDGDSAGLFGAVTVPTHRRRGAQSALIAARIHAASAAGVSWISAETGLETAGHSNPSLRNLRNAGLADLYERPNWVWRAPDR